jgi:hypothetical protein
MCKHAPRAVRRQDSMLPLSFGHKCRTRVRHFRHKPSSQARDPPKLEPEKLNPQAGGVGERGERRRRCTGPKIILEVGGSMSAGRGQLRAHGQRRRFATANNFPPNDIARRQGDNPPFPPPAPRPRYPPAGPADGRDRRRGHRGIARTRVGVGRARGPIKPVCDLSRCRAIRIRRIPRLRSRGSRSATIKRGRKSIKRRSYEANED